MKKKIILIWIFFVFLGGIYLKCTEKAILHITMCDVGQGDAYLISYKSYQMLIDGGPTRKILECLDSAMPPFDKTIELVVASHPDMDHVAGLEYVLTSYKIDQIVTNGDEKQTKAFLNLKNAMQTSTATKLVAKQGDVFSFQDLHAEVLWPEVNDPKTVQPVNTDNIDKSIQSSSTATKKTDDTNTRSIVLRLEFGDFSALFTGDLEANQEKTLLQSGQIAHITLLKVGHHGSRFSTSEPFLEALSPFVAFIGVGKGNTYGHPTAKVLNLLEKYHVSLYRSDINGQVTLETDGKSIWKM
jgi:competence protein ComEC